MTDSYFLAPALVTLRDEIDKQFPHRDKTSDGWIGDASHAARASDHNPCWSCTGRMHGIVRAIDVDIDGNDPKRDLRREILNAAIGDPRVWYVISNEVIYSKTYGWEPRHYTGSNPHDHHVHISLLANVGEFDTSAWFEDPPPKIQAKPVSLEEVRTQFLNAINGLPVGFSNGVGRIQRSLNKVYGTTLDVDGLVGRATIDAWVKHEQHVGVQGRSRVPDHKTLPALAKGRFRVVE